MPSCTLLATLVKPTPSWIVKWQKIMRSLFFIPTLFVLLQVTVACDEDAEDLPQPELEFPVFSAEQLESAATYSTANGGSAVLVMQYGERIFEDYQHGADTNTATHIQSGTKGFFAAAVAAAIEDGLITGYDELVAETITEWKDPNQHPGKQLIRVRHLVSLTSGLSQDIDQIQGAEAPAEDIYQYVVDSLRLVTVPGNHFQYGPSHFYAFGVLLERKLQAAGRNLDPLAYLDERVFKPIKLNYADWIHDASGNPHIPNGAVLTPRNWVKYGRFLLQSGRWEGKPVIASELIDDLTQPYGINPGHGAFLWLNSVDGYPADFRDMAPAGSSGGFIYHDGHPDIYAALGAGKNRMYIIPEYEAVVVRQTLSNRDGFDDHTFLQYLLGEGIE